MENSEISTKIVENVVKIMDVNGVARFKDEITGKFVKPTGEYAQYFITNASEGSYKVADKLSDSLKKVLLESADITGIKSKRTNWKMHTLIGIGIATVSVGSFVLYERSKVKKRKKELNKLGFEFINGPFETIES